MKKENDDGVSPKTVATFSFLLKNIGGRQKSDPYPGTMTPMVPSFDYDLRYLRGWCW